MAQVRDIEYRAKTVYDGKWVYGFPMHYTNPHYEKWTIREPSGLEHDVCEETLWQYIGRKDAKGTKMYEGDVFTVNGRYPKLIKYLDTSHCFAVANLDALTDPCSSRWPDECNYQQPALDWWNDFKHELLVVDNVHDNPDLIKVKEQ